jgi:hypothetical protein
LKGLAKREGDHRIAMSFLAAFGVSFLPRVASLPSLSRQVHFFSQFSSYPVLSFSIVFLGAGKKRDEAVVVENEKKKHYMLRNCGNQISLGEPAKTKSIKI